MLPETVTLTIEEYLNLVNKGNDKTKYIEALLDAANLPFVESSSTYGICNRDYKHHYAGQVRAWNAFRKEILKLIKNFQDENK